MIFLHLDNKGFVDFFNIFNEIIIIYFFLITKIKTGTVIVLCDFCKSWLIKTKKLENTENAV